MTPETMIRLQARQEQLLELFLLESDPTKWPGAGVEPAAMEKTTRGDRYWCKKDAVASLALAVRIGGLITYTQQHPPGEPQPADGEQGAPLGEGDTLDSDIAAAEREAERMMSRAVQKAANVLKG